MLFLLCVYSIFCSGIEENDDCDNAVGLVIFVKPDNFLVIDAREEEEPRNCCKKIIKFVVDAKNYLVRKSSYSQLKKTEEPTEDSLNIEDAFRLMAQSEDSSRTVYKAYEKCHNVLLDNLFKFDFVNANFEVDQIRKIAWGDLNNIWQKRKNIKGSVLKGVYKKSLKFLKEFDGDGDKKKFAEHLLNLFIYHASTTSRLDMKFVMFLGSRGDFYIRNDDELDIFKRFYTVLVFDNVTKNCHEMPLDEKFRVEVLISQVICDIQGTLIVYDL